VTAALAQGDAQIMTQPTVKKRELNLETLRIPASPKKTVPRTENVYAALLSLLST
jgi:hypothetical protein